jgi:Fe-S-cluster containining protein
METDEIFQSYERHLADVEAEFRRVSARFASRMQCRRGCSMCCSQMFSISMIEAAYISRAIKSLPDDERERLREKARGYVAQAKSMTGDGGGAGEEEAVTPRPGHRLPCPALEGDACSIYSARPIICRKWGIPIFNPRKPAELQACELNFKPGEEIEIDGLIEPQVALLEDWVELKGRTRRALNHAEVRTTVAEAILVDYEQALLSQKP